MLKGRSSRGGTARQSRRTTTAAARVARSEMSCGRRPWNHLSSRSPARPDLLDRFPHSFVRDAPPAEEARQPHVVAAPGDRTAKIAMTSARSVGTPGIPPMGEISMIAGTNKNGPHPRSPSMATMSSTETCRPSRRLHEGGPESLRLRGISPPYQLAPAISRTQPVGKAPVPPPNLASVSGNLTGQRAPGAAQAGRRAPAGGNSFPWEVEAVGGALSSRPTLASGAHSGPQLSGWAHRIAADRA
jgi:hypothetical protein